LQQDLLKRWGDDQRIWSLLADGSLMFSCVQQRSRLKKFIMSDDGDDWQWIEDEKKIEQGL